MPAQHFRHVHAEKAALYRAVMRAFSAARRRFLVHLRPEDVQAAPELEELGQALASLVERGNLRADADTSRVESVDDFYRKRLLYQLTAEGEAAEAALETYDRTLGHRGELQAVALDDIRFHLRALARLLEEGEDDAERAHRLLRDLVLVFERLADNTQAFMASLRRTIDLQDGDVEAFVAYKERLVSNLERFVGDLTRASHEIAELLGGLPVPGVDRLLRLAAGREAADALPSPEPGTEGERADLQTQRAAVARRVAELERAMKAFAAEHGGRWCKSVREPGGWRPLLRGAVQRLLALGLVEEAEGGLRPLPPLARWSAGAARIAGREEPA